MRRLFTLMLAFLLTVGTGAAASAAWQLSGQGEGDAASDMIPRTALLHADGGQGFVDLEWGQTVMSNGAAVTGYRILRNGVPVCDSPVPASTLTCRDDGLPPNEYEYSVIALLEAWVGPESPPLTATVTGQPLPSTMYVRELTGQSSGNNPWDATVSVTIYRTGAASDVPVSGARVTGIWEARDISGQIAECDTATDSNGTCSVMLTGISNGGANEAEFTITGVEHDDYDYDGTNNVEGSVKVKK